MFAQKFCQFSCLWQSIEWMGRILPRALCFASIMLLGGCHPETETAGRVALSHVTSQAAATALGVAQAHWGHIPVPPDDAETLAPLTLAAQVWDAPDAGSKPVGYLRLGEKVPRSERPISSRNCRGGWFAVRPLGFVCDGDGVTTDLSHPLVQAFPHGPDRRRPLPYQYAFVRAIAPNYLTLPSQEEQLRYEMQLERHLRSYARLKGEWNRIEPGANEVALSPSGAATGEEAFWTEAPSLSERFGGDGTDRIPFWLQGKRQIPNVSTFRAPPYAVIAGRVKRHAGVALVDSFVAPDEAFGRRFAVSVDGRLLPADKLKAETASPFHGFELQDQGLPAGIVYNQGARVYGEDLGVTSESLAHRSLVLLTGEVRVRGGVRYVRGRDGHWYKSGDLRVAAQPSSLPWFARKQVRWIDISILSQTLVLYEGSTPRYITMISSGRDGLGDPKESYSTPTGTFRIYQKHVTNTMDSNVADNEFELRDVPWVMYFEGGYALHAAYWHDDFGKPRSHGCVNLAPIDARYIFSWTSPDVPEHWHGAYAGDTMGKGTLINIHP